MKLHKYLKITLVLLAASVQSMLLDWLLGGLPTDFDIHIAGEVPDPGTILLFGLGALMLLHENRKQRKRQ